MAADAFVLSAADRAALIAALRRSRAEPLNPRGREVPPRRLGTTPEVYVARAPSGGIQSRIFNLPGHAECDIYRLVPSTPRPALRAAGFTRIVYNLTGVILQGPGGLRPYFLTHRDKFGDWYVKCATCIVSPPGTATSSGTGTGTGSGTGTGTAVDSIPNPWACCPALDLWPNPIKLTVVGIRPDVGEYGGEPDYPHNFDCMLGVTVPMSFHYGPGDGPNGEPAGAYSAYYLAGSTGLGPLAGCDEGDGGIYDSLFTARLFCGFNNLTGRSVLSLFLTGDLIHGFFGDASATFTSSAEGEEINPFTGLPVIYDGYNICDYFGSRPLAPLAFTVSVTWNDGFTSHHFADIDFVMHE